VNILFIHQNFPGQFKFLAPALAAAGHRVVALSMQAVPTGNWRGVNVVAYAATRGSTRGVHPWIGDFETKVIRGEACFRAALRLRDAGFVPDVVIAHPGWGESLFVKEVWPQTRLGIYCEYFYRRQGGDVGFDPEFAVGDVGEACRLQMKNLNYRLHFDCADLGIAPTRWQASTFPQAFAERISVIHDGIDTAAVVPRPDVRMMLNERLTLTRDDEVITFVNRNLEPMRGYHVFMRALPEILKRRPRARVIIVGGDEVSYGAKAPGGRSWKEIYAAEVRPKIPDADWGRVHFVGKLAYPQFVSLLQLSTVHVYLTYPFVLSWSLLEAMSAGCAIVASATAPLREAIEHDRTGRLVDFFDVTGLADEVCELLADPAARQRLGAAARTAAVAHYDLQRVCLPAQLAWIDQLASC